MAWIPPYLVTNTWGTCTAKIRGSGTRVSAIDLLASFDQLGSRCQNGFFYYDNGWIDAQLNGRTGWKRDTTGKAQEWYSNETVSHTGSQPPDWVALPLGAKATPRKLKGRTANGIAEKVPDGIEKRQSPIGKYIGTIPGSPSSFRIFRGARVVIGGPPDSAFLPEKALFAIGRVLDNIKSNSGTGVVRGGVETISGSTVNALAIVAQLNTVGNNWKNLYKNIGRGTIEGVMLAAFSNMLSDHLNAGVYHVYNKYNDVLFSVIINGVTGLLSSLPTS
ncbi:hypothetical protein TWF481_010361 [Arthrobotrys musiformis]|uniref:Uncharacterized protein n=1 Tax=Arthrobotrys musiformis TaxID=47236 RepID=A0AAV9W3E3_9PEZI